MPLLHKASQQDSVFDVMIGPHQPQERFTARTARSDACAILRLLLSQFLLFVGLVLVVMSLPTLVRFPYTPTAPVAPVTVTPAGERFVVVGSIAAPVVPADGRVWVVTAASSVYFDRVSNFVGSMHTYAVGVPVLIYDLGLTAEQRQQIAAWQNVSVRAFPFDAYPQHVRNLFSYAWKLLIHHRAFSDLPAHTQRIVVLDSGLELRSHIALPRIADAIQRQGYWMASQANTIDRMSHPQTIEKLNISWSTIVGKAFCAGGLVGWQRGSEAHSEMVGRAYSCALDESCILPQGAGHSNHRDDQVVISALVYDTGRQCEKERQWREWDMTQLTENEAEDGEAQSHQRKVWIAARRWHQPKPFAYRIALVDPAANSLASGLPPASAAESSFPNDCLTRPGMSLALSEWVPPSPVCSRSWEESSRGEGRLSSRRLFSERTALRMAANTSSESDVRRCVEGLVLSTLDQTKLDFGDELRVCLGAHDNSRWECRDAILRHWERLSDEADDALCVAEQMTAMQYELAHSALPVHFTLPPIKRLVLAQEHFRHALWLLCDLALTPIARRAQQWRYYWLVFVLQLLVVATRRAWRLRRKGLSSSWFAFSGGQHRRYS